MQQRTKDKKAFMLHQKGCDLRREAKSVGHWLSLVTCEEDDEKLWQKYSKLMARSKELEVISGYRDEKSFSTKARNYCKPVFDETYITITNELKKLYAMLSVTDDPAKRHMLYEKIAAKKKERWETFTYVSRETGEPIKVTVDQYGKAIFELFNVDEGEAV